MTTLEAWLQIRPRAIDRAFYNTLQIRSAAVKALILKSAACLDSAFNYKEDPSLFLWDCPNCGLREMSEVRHGRQEVCLECGNRAFLLHPWHVKKYLSDDIYAHKAWRTCRRLMIGFSNLKNAPPTPRNLQIHEAVDIIDSMFGFNAGERPFQCPECGRLTHEQIGIINGIVLCRECLTEVFTIPYKTRLQFPKASC